MNTPDSTRVIQGDEGCRDGHYRAKQDVREHCANSEGARQAAELDPNDATSQEAQNPTDFGEMRGRAWFGRCRGDPRDLANHALWLWRYGPDSRSGSVSEDQPGDRV